MRFPFRILALLVASAVISAAATPCPPNPEAHLKSATGESSESSVKAKCPCSCSEGEPPRLASTHLDFATLRNPADTVPAPGWGIASTSHHELPPPPFAPLETVPI